MHRYQRLELFLQTNGFAFLPIQLRKNQLNNAVKRISFPEAFPGRQIVKSDFSETWAVADIMRARRLGQLLGNYLEQERRELVYSFFKPHTANHDNIKAAFSSTSPRKMLTCYLDNDQSAIYSIRSAFPSIPKDVATVLSSAMNYPHLLDEFFRVGGQSHLVENGFSDALIVKPVAYYQGPLVTLKQNITDARKKRLKNSRKKGFEEFLIANIKTEESLDSLLTAIDKNKTWKSYISLLSPEEFLALIRKADCLNCMLEFFTSSTAQAWMKHYYDLNPSFLESLVFEQACLKIDYDWIESVLIHLRIEGKFDITATHGHSAIEANSIIALEALEELNGGWKRDDRIILRQIISKHPSEVLLEKYLLHNEASLSMLIETMKSKSNKFLKIFQSRFLDNCLSKENQIYDYANYRGLRKDAKEACIATANLFLLDYGKFDVIAWMEDYLKAHDKSARPYLDTLETNHITRIFSLLEVNLRKRFYQSAVPLTYDSL